MKANADTTPEIPDLKPCPAPGDGVHTWIYGACCRFQDAGWNLYDAQPLIIEALSRDEKGDEIEDAWRSASGERPKSRVVPARPELIARYSDGCRVEELIARAPEPLNSHAPADKVNEILTALFPGSDSLLSLGHSYIEEDKKKYRFATRALKDWLWLFPHHEEFIVPSVMLSRRGLTKQGNLSAKCESNTGERCYVIAEFDKGSLDSQTSRLWHLNTIRPMCLAVFSGSKSVHGWFACKGEPEEKIERFFLIVACLARTRK